MKNEKLKVILIIIIVFVLIPLSILTILYNTSNGFKIEANKYLRNMPGKVGDYFNQYPTNKELNDKILYIAEYYSFMDSDAAADKLYIIKEDDEELYHQIIKQMNKLSSDKTEEVLTKIRDIELRKNLLISVYDEIVSTKENELLEDVKKIEGMDLLVAKNLILQYYNDENFERVNDIFNIISIDKAVDLIYYFEDDIYDYIFNNLENDRKIKIDTDLTEKELENEKLISKSEIYQVNDNADIIEEIGNTDNYNYNQLAIIYLNLTVEKSSEILSQIEDKEFLEELFSEMKNIELLNAIKDPKTVKIASEIENIKEYNAKINDLVKIYQKMSSNAVSSIIEKMFKDDPELAIDLIGSMSEAKMAEILNYVDTDIANQISKELTS
ncbi:hypothetical protein GOQ29_10540 [Clostridium sp. D2Q-14]|uniref:hypothetical protein n=1 Tax=Anaeromonas gelatinilytica TaxID=2683194 RepID=UPI00193BC405|nr:hypothetical protein [Anaeromonas gelatinilytica]MBS4536051.1 hypothetical protein [Anaeromonas gelatinilytica]